MTTSSILWLSAQIALFSLLGFIVFALLRRRGPNAAAACAATVLGLTLPLAVLAVSPWPRWELPQKRDVLANDPAQPAAASEAEVIDHDRAVTIAAPPDQAASDPTETALLVWWRNALDWFQAVEEPIPAATTSTATWRTWLPWLLAAGVAFGLARLIVGILAMRSFRRHSVQIDAADLQASVQQLAGQLQTSIVEVRESARLRSAATIGWRHPLLLLPAEWRSWTETERCVVIAHELAHVARRDYLLVLVARLATAIHFYQPLVLWLARQLRVQQELAADAQAAAITGSRQTYLTTLAQMALRADEQSIPWPARAFLPGTGLLVKRVTWLKRNKTTEERTMTRKSRWILAATMAAVALFVAGIRGPQNGGTTVAHAAEANGEQTHAQHTAGEKPVATPAGRSENKHTLAIVIDAKPRRTIDYIPADAKLVIVASPSQLAKSPALASLFSSIDKITSQDTILEMPFADLEDVMLVKTSARKITTVPTFDRIIYRATKPHQWKALLDHFIPERVERKIGDKTYYAATKPLATSRPYLYNNCYYMPDDRTLVLGTEAEILKMLIGERKVSDAEQKAVLTENPLAIVVEANVWRSVLDLDGRKDINDPVIASLLPVLDHTKRIFLSAGMHPGKTQDGNEQAVIGVTLLCESDDAAEHAAATLDALRILSLNASVAAEKRFSDSLAETSPNLYPTVVVTAQLWGLAARVLENTKVRANEEYVQARCDFAVPSETVTAILLPAVQASRDAARRTQSMNNMKQIGLALHNYADKYKHFPPPAIRDQDGKPLLSWRVAILPYIDEEALYKEFRLDEPWDSEHNRKLSDIIVPLFRNPSDNPIRPNASYFMVTGKGTFGDTERGRMFKEITDGTVHTIMLVEAKRDIPWAKPEDIEIDPDPAKPLPKFGGFSAGLFNAGFADGSVRTISDAADPMVLRKLFTVDGNEPIDELELTQPQPAERKPPAPAAATPDEKKGAGRLRIEFRRAEDQPGEGLTEVEIPDRSGKVYLRTETELSNDDIADVRLVSDEATGMPAISVTFTKQGAEKMLKLTENHLRKPLAILVDGKVLSAPIVQSRLSDKAMITGNFTQEEAERIAKGIRGQ